MTADPDLVARAGRALFGDEDWLAQLAEALEVSPRALRYMLKGEKPISSGLSRDLATLCRERSERLSAIADELSRV